MGGGNKGNVLHAHGILTSTGEARCPVCNGQHTCTGADGVMMISTCLRDYDIGYSSNKSGKRSAINKFKALIGCMQLWTAAHTGAQRSATTRKDWKLEGIQITRRAIVQKLQVPKLPKERRSSKALNQAQGLQGRIQEDG